MNGGSQVSSRHHTSSIKKTVVDTSQKRANNTDGGAGKDDYYDDDDSSRISEQTDQHNEGAEGGDDEEDDGVYDEVGFAKGKRQQDENGDDWSETSAGNQSSVQLSHSQGRNRKQIKSRQAETAVSGIGGSTGGGSTIVSPDWKNWRTGKGKCCC